MQYLLDTGVVLRLVNRQAELHADVRSCIRKLKADGHVTVTSVQNVVEFWNVCTRPAESRGGLGLTLDETRKKVATVERIMAILPYPAGLYTRWKELVTTRGVKGVQVHDAKIAALMDLYGIQNLLTLNPSDFGRYPTLNVVTPPQIISA